MTVREAPFMAMKDWTDDASGSSGTLRVTPFRFVSGEVLDHVNVHFQAWGQLNSDKSNAILVCHALTGDANAGGSAKGRGWWAQLIGPGLLLDTNRYFVICSNVVGGCNGSTGPASLALDGRPYGLRFPATTVRDMVALQQHLLDGFGISRLVAVIGGSLGGMQAWEWATSAPDYVAHAIVIAAHPAYSPLGIGYNEAMRQTIVADGNWQGGNYYGTGRAPTAGLAAARAIGMLTYRTDALFWSRYGRSRSATASHSGDVASPVYEVESYLRHHGEKLNSRFDANSYLYLLRAMDHHDIGWERGGLESALRRIQCRLTIAAIEGDYLYPPDALLDTARLAVDCGVSCEYLTWSSDFGHDAFLTEQDSLSALLRRSGLGVKQ